MLGRVKCPRCAGVISRDAGFCHHCGCKQPARDGKKARLSPVDPELTSPPPTSPSPTPLPAKARAPLTIPTAPASTAPVAKQQSSNFGCGLVLVVILIAAVAFCQPAARESENLQKAAQTVNDPGPTTNVAVEEQTAQYPALGIGETIEWTASASDDEVIRTAGPFLVRITKQLGVGVAAPVVHVSAAGQEVVLQGADASPDTAHRITAFVNRAGAPPAVMLQSFTGGAHCCNEVTLAGISNGVLKKLSLGSFDGDSIETPRDRSGDGIADFVLRDDRFLYAFSTYASSFSPPKILNVVNGRVVDVSARKEFRSLNLEAMRSAEDRCTSPGTGDARNGACAGYVAAAARLGRLTEAWSKMLASFDSTAVTDLPLGCQQQTAGDCPSDQTITFRSYPEALLNFLQSTRYISKSWTPPTIAAGPSVPNPVEERANTQI